LLKQNAEQLAVEPAVTRNTSVTSGNLSSDEKHAAVDVRSVLKKASLQLADLGSYGVMSSLFQSKL